MRPRRQREKPCAWNRRTRSAARNEVAEEPSGARTVPMGVPTRTRTTGSAWTRTRNARRSEREVESPPSAPPRAEDGDGDGGTGTGDGDGRDRRRRPRPIRGRRPRPIRGRRPRPTRGRPTRTRAIAPCRGKRKAPDANRGGRQSTSVDGAGGVRQVHESGAAPSHANVRGRGFTSVRDRARDDDGDGGGEGSSARVRRGARWGARRGAGNRTPSRINPSAGTLREMSLCVGVWGRRVGVWW